MVGIKFAFLVSAIIAVSEQRIWGHHGESCDQEDRRNHAINLLKEWVKHDHYDAVAKLYLDIYKKELPSNGRRQLRYASDFDEAFTHGNTVPDYRHVEWYIWQMHHACRYEIMKWIQAYPLLKEVCTLVAIHVRIMQKEIHDLAHTHSIQTTKPTTHAPTTQAPTEKPHVQAHTTHPPKQTTHAPATPEPTTTAKPTGTPEPTTTQAPATTQNVDLTKYNCNPVTFVTALATSNQLVNDNAGRCTDGSKTQPEALILESCNAPSTTSWKQGVQVVKNCTSIPDYTPIATFIFGEYELNGLHMAGILTECTATGFKMAVQLCGHPVDIIEVKSGALHERENADSYYTITW